MEEIRCEFCNEIVKYDLYYGRFCSRKCYDDYNKGFKKYDVDRLQEEYAELKEQYKMLENGNKQLLEELHMLVYERYTNNYTPCSQCVIKTNCRHYRYIQNTFELFKDSPLTVNFPRCKMYESILNDLFKNINTADFIKTDILPDNFVHKMIEKGFEKINKGE